MSVETESEWIRGRAQELAQHRAPVDLEALLDLVVVGVAAQLEAERATLYLLHVARNELVSRVATGLTDLTIRLAVGEGAAGTVAADGVPVRLRADRARSQTITRYDALTSFDTRSLLAVPVRGGDGALLGVLQVLNAHAGEFTAADEEELAALAAQVGALIDATSLRAQLQGGEQALSFRFNGIVGESTVMQRVYDRAARAAPTEATVLIRGASVNGKELVARAVHANSERADRPLVKVDCGALPLELVENELFGHEKGAYTGASARGQDGKLAAADGGTLFLDEIGELPLVAQTKLLRFLQDRTWFRVGGTRLHTADVRVVAASHKDLEAAVEEGTFRQDLYYRLRVVEIVLPELRARGHGDLDRLVDHFFWEAKQRYSRAGLTLSPSARRRLHAHAWPGNVRELEHVITSAVVLAPGPEVQAADLELGPGGPEEEATPAVLGATGLPDRPDSVRPLADVEREYAAAALRACGGNRSDAARRLGIGRNTLLRKLKA